MAMENNIVKDMDLQTFVDTFVLKPSKKLEQTLMKLNCCAFVKLRFFDWMIVSAADSNNRDVCRQNNVQ